MAYTLPDLDYGYDALQPHIDARTMEIHHQKHHQAYINKVNDALSGTAFEGKPIEEVLRNINDVPSDIRQAVINHGGGYANHKLFWQIMSPNGGGEPGGSLGEAISETFGSYDDFKSKLSTAAAGQFGSGWGWLVVDGGGKLMVTSTANQDSPLMDGHTPILGVDVWEHAYYLNYQNRRPDYIEAWFNTIHWGKVQELYDAAR